MINDETIRNEIKLREKKVPFRKYFQEYKRMKREDEDNHDNHEKERAK